MSDIVQAEQPTVKVTVILNPLKPKEAFEQFVIPFEAGCNLSDYVTDVGDVVIAYRGAIVEGLLKDIEVVGNTEIIVCPVPRGGGSNPIMRIVAFMAIAVIASMTGGFALGALGTVEGGAFTAGSLMMSYGIQMGVMIVGGLLLNELMPFPEPGAADSPTYALSGPVNTVREGGVVPVCYGQHIMAGTRIGNYAKNDTANRTQVFYGLYCLGEGEIAGITDIRLNDQPIENFQDVEYVVRTGTANQKPIPWFNNTIVPLSVGPTLLGTSYTVITTTQEIDQFTLDFSCQDGLYFRSSDGSLGPIGTNIQVRYRKVGDVAWIYASPGITGYTTYYDYTYDNGGGGIPLRVHSTTLGAGFSVQNDSTKPNYNGIYLTASGSPLTGPVQWVGAVHKEPIWGSPGGLDGDGNPYYSISAQCTTAYNFSIEAGNGLEEANYEIGVRVLAPGTSGGKNNNKCWIAAVNQITSEKVKYKNTAVLALKMRLTDQISGVPNVTYRHLGKLIQVRRLDPTTKAYQWSLESSSNPAWIAYDIATNTRYGGNTLGSDIDLARYQELADFCQDNAFEFNGVFDTSNNIWDAIGSALRCGYATSVLSGTKYSLSIDKTETPSMVFNEANTVKGTVKMSWLPFADRANEIIMEIFDEADNYKNRTVKIVDPGVPASEIQKSVTLAGFGITKVKQAVIAATVQMNKNRRQTKTLSFEAPIEAMAVTVGDVFAFQSSVLEWGNGGRLESGSTTTVLAIDVPVTMLFGETYKTTVHYNTLVRASGTINSVVGTYVYLNSYTGNTAVRTLKVGVNEYRVLRVIDNGAGLYGVQLDAAVMPASGLAYQLYDLDVLESRDVVNPGTGTYTSITVSSALPSAPAANQKWIFGPSSQITEKYRVLKVSSGSQGYTRSIEALQYDEDVYDYPSTVLPLEETPGYGRPQHVTNLGYALGSRRVGTQTAAVVHLNWDLPISGTYSGAEIYASYDNAPYKLVGKAEKGATSWNDNTIAVTATATYRVVTIDALGMSAGLVGAPTVYVVVTTAALPYGQPVGLTATGGEGKVSLAWSVPVDNPGNIAYYEIWRHTANTRDGSEVLVGRSLGTSYIDPVNAGTYYYWVRVMDTAGQVGDWNSSMGVSGVSTAITTSADALTATAVSPTAPTGFSSTAAFYSIILKWVNQVTPYFGYTEVWSSATNDVTTATLVYRGKAEVFAHTVTRGSTNYYWLRSINMWGVQSGYDVGNTAGHSVTTNVQISGPDLTANSVTANEIAANAITADELAAGAVVAGKIAAGTIVANDIAANTITGAKIAADTITAANIAAGAITASEVGANLIVTSNANIGSAVVQTANIVDLNVTTLKIANQAVTVSAGMQSNAVVAHYSNVGENYSHWFPRGTYGADGYGLASFTNFTLASLSVTGFNNPGLIFWGCDTDTFFTSINNGGQTVWVRVWVEINDIPYDLTNAAKAIYGTAFDYTDINAAHKPKGFIPVTIDGAAVIALKMTVTCDATTSAADRFSNTAFVKSSNRFIHYLETKK